MKKWIILSFLLFAVLILGTILPQCKNVISICTYGEQTKTDSLRYKRAKVTTFTTIGYVESVALSYTEEKVLYKITFSDKEYSNKETFIRIYNGLFYTSPSVKKKAEEGDYVSIKVYRIHLADENGELTNPLQYQYNKWGAGKLVGVDFVYRIKSIDSVVDEIDGH